ncbi:MAG: hypothetical protein ABI832_14815 [bacterium]
MEDAMTQVPHPQVGKATKSPRAQHREARLKAALKANMAKRKAQIRARVDDTTAGVTSPENEKE